MFKNRQQKKIRQLRLENKLLREQLDAIRFQKEYDEGDHTDAVNEIYERYLGYIAQAKQARDDYKQLYRETKLLQAEMKKKYKETIKRMKK